MKTLKEAYSRYFRIGAAVNPRSLERFGDLVGSQFSSLTCENEMKFASIEPKPGEYTFGGADIVYDFAKRNDIPMRGHTLLWHAQTPMWVYEGGRDAALARIKSHMLAMAGRYPDIWSWDVVNETIADDKTGALRRSPAYEAIGPDYLRVVYRMAAEIFPNAQLVLNDYNELSPEKRAGMIRAAKDINAEGNIVSTIGMQGHWNIWVDPDDVRRCISEIAEAGFRVQVTELDLSCFKWDEREPEDRDTPEYRAQLAKAYGSIFAVFREFADVIDAVTFWGVDDGSSWLNGFPAGRRPNWPLLFDREGKPKEAYYAVTEF